MKGIDTFDIAKKAKSAGFNQKQTEFLVETVSTIENTHISNLATKDDIVNLETKLETEVSIIKQDIQNLETKLETEISKLESKITNIKNELTIRIGVMMGIAIAIVTWLDKVIM